MSKGRSAKRPAEAVLCSMTGFGAATRDAHGERWSLEVRSVNHRHLLVKCRLPSELAALEGEVEARVRKRLGRGSVSLHLSVVHAPGDGEARLDVDLAERYRDAIIAMARRLRLEPLVRVDTLLGLPGVVRVADERAGGADRARQRRLLFGLLDGALDELVAMRTREGAAIGRDLQKHARAAARVLARIEKRMPKVVQDQRRALHRRLDHLIGEGASVAPEDLARELALLADRLDVSEELARLASHLEHMAEFLATGGALGRKLDFLVQEMFREVNTIGSKCNDARVAHWVIEAKGHVERLREQVQNLE